MRSVISRSGPTVAEYAQPVNSDSVNVTEVEMYSLVGTFTVSAPAAAVFASASNIDATANTFTKVAHGYKTGLKGQVTTSNTLPAGLVALTDYFVIVVDADTIKLASSLLNANAGTAVDITTTGTGNQTFTATAIAGGAAKLQYSNDDTNWIDVASSSQNITATCNLGWVGDRPGYVYVRVACTLTAGQVSTSFAYVAKS